LLLCLVMPRWTTGKRMCSIWLARAGRVLPASSRCLGFLLWALWSGFKAIPWWSASLWPRFVRLASPSTCMATASGFLSARIPRSSPLGRVRFLPRPLTGPVSPRRLLTAARLRPPRRLRRIGATGLPRAPTSRPSLSRTPRYMVDSQYSAFFIFELRRSLGFTIPRRVVPTPLTAGRALVVVALVRGRYLVLRHPCRSSVLRPAWRIE